MINKFLHFSIYKIYLIYVYVKYTYKNYIYYYFINILKKLSTANRNIFLNFEKLIEIFANLNKENIYVLDIAIEYNFDKYLKFVKNFLKFKFDVKLYNLIKDKLTINNKFDINSLEILYKEDKIFLIFDSIFLCLKLLVKYKNIFDSFKRFFNNFYIYIIILGNKFNYDIMNLYIKNNNLKYKIFFYNCKLSSYVNTLSILRDISDLSIKKFLDFKINNNYNFNKEYVNYLNNIIYNTDKLKLKINENDIYNIIKYIKKKLLNQDYLINFIFNSLQQIINKISTKKPIRSWLLCGPSGTGKTELAKILAKVLFKSEKSLIRFNMSEYMEPHSISKLIGSPPGYIGYGEKSRFMTKLQSDSSYIILFDEIEKAHKNINDLMLQILDEGRLTLSNQEIVYFNKSFIIFTSNLGTSNKVVSYNKNYNNNILKEIENYFRPEFLNRLNDIIIFRPTNNYSYYFILNKFLFELSLKFYFSLIIDKDLEFELIKYSYNTLYGLRPLKRNNENIFYKFIIYNNLLNRNYINYNAGLLYNLYNQNILCKYSLYNTYKILR